MKNKLETLFLSTFMFCVNASVLLSVILGYRGIFMAVALFINAIVFGCITKGLIESSDKND